MTHKLNITINHRIPHKSHKFKYPMVAIKIDIMDKLNHFLLLKKKNYENLKTNKNLTIFLNNFNGSNGHIKY